MNRRDLEEAILNAEYLVRHDFDGTKTQEYERLLQALRQELQALNQQLYSLKATANVSQKRSWQRWLRR